MSILVTQEHTAASPAAKTTGILQRKCACGNHAMSGGCEECRKKETLQRSTTSSETINDVPAIVYDVLRSPGQPLDAATRTFMEPRFGHDFSGVRVHSNSQAADSARAVNALAYTVGQNVVFGRGQYAPDTPGGRRLLAHELTHVTQQASGVSASLQTLSEIGPAGDQFEREADRVADKVVSHDQPAKVSPATVSSGTRLQRQALPSPLGQFAQCSVDWLAVFEGRFNLAQHLNCCARLPTIGPQCSKDAIERIQRQFGRREGGATTPRSLCPGREIPVTGGCCPVNQTWNGTTCVPFEQLSTQRCLPGETPNLFGGCCRPGQFFDRMGRLCLPAPNQPRPQSSPTTTP